MWTTSGALRCPSWIINGAEGSSDGELSPRQWKIDRSEGVSPMTWCSESTGDVTGLYPSFRKRASGLKAVVSITWRWEPIPPKVGSRCHERIRSVLSPLPSLPSALKGPKAGGDRYWYSSIHSASGPYLLIREGCDFVSDWQCKTCCHISCDDVNSAMKLCPENSSEPAQYA